MNKYRLQGWMLIIGALINLFVSDFYVLDLVHPNSNPYYAINIIAHILFIAGLPAIQFTQPQTGRKGKIGLILIAIPAALLIIDQASMLILFIYTAYFARLLMPIAELAGYIGYFLVGWLTTKARMFPAWAGWLLISYSVLAIPRIIPIFPVGAESMLTFSFYAITSLVKVAALVGYGWYIIKH